jgi:hypothetical protein
MRVLGQPVWVQFTEFVNGWPGLLSELQFYLRAAVMGSIYMTVIPR